MAIHAELNKLEDANLNLVQAIGKKGENNNNPNTNKNENKHNKGKQKTRTINPKASISGNGRKIILRRERG